MHTQTTDLVTDPVAHISISGVHGRDELDERLASAPAYRDETEPATMLLVGAAIGAALMYLLKR